MPPVIHRIPCTLREAFVRAMTKTIARDYHSDTRQVIEFTDGSSIIIEGAIYGERWSTVTDDTYAALEIYYEYPETLIETPPPDNDARQAR